MSARSSNSSRLKAVILAGEWRTDFAPESPGVPKPMYPAGQQFIYAHLLEFLRQHGIYDVLVCLDKKLHISSEFFRTDLERGMEISYVVEETPQGTAGCLRGFKNFLCDETFVLIT